MTTRPRVLVIPSWYPSGDSPTSGVFIYQQVQALREVADVAVVYVREAPEGLAPGITVEEGLTVVRACLRMPAPSRTLPGRAVAVLTNVYHRFIGYRRAGARAFETLRAEWGMPDIVHVQAMWPAAMIARDIQRLYRVPYVITEHSEEYSAASERRLVKTPGMLPHVLRPLAKRASRTIAVSRFLGDRLAALGLARDPAVVPNVIPDASPAPVVHAAPLVILHVSVMGPAKDINGLVEAVDLLRRRRTDFVLRLVGDGMLRRDMEAKVRGLGLETFVEFVGSKSPAEVTAIRAQSAFAVVGSIHETFSVVAAESLMSGRPVLSTRCGGPEEFITPQVGRLVPAQDSAALADGLDWMLDHYAEFDPIVLHDYAVSRFSPEVVAQQILAVYREVIGG